MFDAAKNIYGVDPATGAALRPCDNIGVQYGLNALNSGAITVAQFLDLNEKIGGFDQDANYVPTRTRRRLRRDQARVSGRSDTSARTAA